MQGGAERCPTFDLSSCRDIRSGSENVSSSDGNIRAELLSEARELSASLTARFATSPLSEVGARLSGLLDGVSHAVDAGHPPQQLRVAIGSVRSIKRFLPEALGARFIFDAELITQIREEWEKAGARLSGAIIPRYAGDGWSFTRVPMPSEDPENAHVMRVLSLPGSDRLADIDLSEYGWLFHELAHDSFYRPHNGFADRFGAVLNSRIRSLKLRGAADGGATARLSDQRLGTLESHWKPRRDQCDWAHEIASDVAALWAIGPAFVACFTRLLASNPQRAIGAGGQHPPHMTRASALVLAAERLGWPDDAWSLEEEVAIIRQRNEIDRSALVFGDQELLESAVNAALESCTALSIPAMTAERYAALRNVSEADAARLAGSELIAVSAILRQRLSAPRYRAWVDSVVRA